MGSPLSLSDMPENQRRVLLQIITDKTKLSAYEECLVSGSDCADKIVRGHLIPMAWLRVIDEDNQVMAFAKAPVHTFRDEEGEDFVLPVTKREIKQTLIGRFSCEKHEQIFFPVDKKEPDITDATNLNLLLYRGIIAQMWGQRRLVRAWDALLNEVPCDKAVRAVVDTYRHNCTDLSHYKAQVERCLFPKKCATCNYGSKQCKKIVHKTRELRGAPVLAVAQFSDGGRTRILYDGEEQITANCGITIFPTSSGHTVVEHYFAVEKLIWGKENSLWPNLQTKSGKELEETVSMLALDYCENIAMNPKHWDKFGKKRHRAIRERFTETIDTPFGSIEKMQRQAERQLPTHLPDYVPNRRLLNLFRADRY